MKVEKLLGNDENCKNFGENVNENLRRLFVHFLGRVLAVPFCRVSSHFCPFWPVLAALDLRKMFRKGAGDMSG